MPKNPGQKGQLAVFLFFSGWLTTAGPTSPTRIAMWVRFSSPLCHDRVYNDPVSIRISATVIQRDAVERN